jgi:hypothetical protein
MIGWLKANTQWKPSLCTGSTLIDVHFEWKCKRQREMMYIRNRECDVSTRRQTKNVNKTTIAYSLSREKQEQKGGIKSSGHSLYKPSMTLVR